MTGRRTFITGRPWEAKVGFARAVRIGAAIEVAGCAPTDRSGKTVGGPDIYKQTRQCLLLIQEALAGVGAGLEDVTRTRIFTTEPRKWREIGRAHEEFFGAIKPVNSLIAVRGFIDPQWMVEIEASAYRVEQ